MRTAVTRRSCSRQANATCAGYTTRAGTPAGGADPCAIEEEDAEVPPRVHEVYVKADGAGVGDRDGECDGQSVSGP